MKTAVFLGGMLLLLLLQLLLPGAAQDRTRCVPNPDDACGKKDRSHCADWEVLHCQLDRGTSKFAAVCAPVTFCGKGTYARVDGENCTVVCEHCHGDHFSPGRTASNDTPNPECEEERHRCDESKVTCDGGSPFHDDTCRCKWEAGYLPRLQKCRNGCHKNKDPSCEVCDPHSCKTGEALNASYECVSSKSEEYCKALLGGVREESTLCMAAFLDASRLLGSESPGNRNGEPLDCQILALVRSFKASLDNFVLEIDRCIADSANVAEQLTNLLQGKGTNDPEASSLSNCSSVRTLRETKRAAENLLQERSENFCTGMPTAGAIFIGILVGFFLCLAITVVIWLVNKGALINFYHVLARCLRCKRCRPNSHGSEGYELVPLESAPPIMLEACNIAEKSVTLAWENSGEGLQSMRNELGDGPLQVKLQKRTGNRWEDCSSVSEGETRRVVENLDPSTKYTFRLLFCSEQKTVPSCPLQVKTAAPPMLEACNIAEKSVTLAWENNGEGMQAVQNELGDGPLRVKLQRRTGNEWEDCSSVSEGETRKVVENLEPGTKYTFRLLFCSEQKTVPSRPLQVKTAAPPIMLEACNIAEKSVTLAWENNGEGMQSMRNELGDGPLQVTVQKRTGNRWEDCSSVSEGETRRVVENLEPSTMYMFRVQFCREQKTVPSCPLQVNMAVPRLVGAQQSKKDPSEDDKTLQPDLPSAARAKGSVPTPSGY